MKNSNDSFPPQEKLDHIENLIQEVITPKNRKQSYKQNKNSRKHLIRYIDALIKLYR